MAIHPGVAGALTRNRLCGGEVPIFDFSNHQLPSRNQVEQVLRLKGNVGMHGSLVRHSTTGDLYLAGSAGLWKLDRM